jgi:hypothetical protein
MRAKAKWYVLTFLIVSHGLAAAETINCAESPHRYRYAGLTRGEAEPLAEYSMSIDADQGIQWAGHAGEGLRICEDAYTLYCFQGRVISFAVPKKGLDVGLAWANNKRTYKVIEKQNFALMGLRTEVFAIQGDAAFNDTANILYYYSVDRGLLAMSILAPRAQKPFLLLTESGYGFPVRNCTLPPDLPNRRPRLRVRRPAIH